MTNIMEYLKKAQDLNKAVFKLRINGLITPSTTEKIKKDLRRFRFYSPVALAVVINSMGGSASQSYIIREELLSYASSKKIKIFTFIEDFATSGAYLIVTAGDSIYSSQGSLIGSIGSSFTHFDLSELADSYGIQRRLWATSTKDISSRLDLLRPFSQDSKNWAQNILKQSTEELKDAIQQVRKNKIKNDAALNGEIFGAKEALQIGLVDEFGTCEEIINKNFPKTKILEITRKEFNFHKG